MSPLVKYVLRNLGTKPFLTGLVVGSMLIVGMTIAGVTAAGGGLRRAFGKKGHENWVIVLSPATANTERESGIPTERLGMITVGPEVKRASIESVNVSMIGTAHGVVVVTLRGLDQVGFDIHDMKLLSGRMPTPAAFEFIAGDVLIRNHPWIGIGTKLKFVNDLELTCVGIFHTPGFMSGEAWTTRATITLDSNRVGSSSVFLETDSAANAAALASRLSGLHGADLLALPEPSFYRRMQTEFSAMSNAMLLIFALVVGGATLVGAALLVVLQHRRLPDLCVLRAMGFRDRAIARLILFETMIIVGGGGAAGVGIAVLALRNFTISTVSRAAAPIDFEAYLDLPLAAITLGVIAFIGLIGASVPIRRMRRMPITRGLREE